jgi:hypothetical protein
MRAYPVVDSAALAVWSAAEHEHREKISAACGLVESNVDDRAA